jgi:Icc-related predicted phosphoesterase
MKMVALSDTHGNHRSVDIPEGDIIIHCGDFTRKSNYQEVMDFIQWYSELKFSHKILVAGNHDRFIEKRKQEFLEIINGKDIIYLENQSVQLEGYKLFGSPYTPIFGGIGAFTYPNEEEAREIWDIIPDGSDIIITHGPPMGFRDYSKTENKNTGCAVLLEQILKIKPAYHIFGHLHESYGIDYNEDTVFVNASLVNRAEELINNPIVIEV